MAPPSGSPPEVAIAQRENGYQTETCRFEDGGELVQVGFTMFSERGDARLAEQPAPWERGAVAYRRGRRVLKVRSTDREAAEAVAQGLLTEEVRTGPVPLTLVQRALVELGFRVDACREERDGPSEQRFCDIRSASSGGFASVSWTTGQAIAPGDGARSYEGSEAKLDLEGLVVRVRLHTEAASAARLARFRGAPVPTE